MHFRLGIPSCRQLVAALPCTLALLLSESAHAACTAKALIQLATDATRLASAPQLASTEAAPVRTASLLERTLASDGLLYAALWTPTQVWVLRYGGLDGERAWFGPFSPTWLDLSGCKPAMALLPNASSAPPPRVRADEPQR